MPWNKLLAKQVRNHLTDECLADPRILRFVEAVNNSYQSFERDRALSAHAFKISEEEYAVINERLREEVELKRLGINHLKDAIRSIDGSREGLSTACVDEDNLIDTLSYLHEQIARWKKVEMELQRLSLVASANENGVLFTDLDGVITWANEGFVRLTGFSMEEILGRTAVDLCKIPLREGDTLETVQEVLHAGKSFDVEVIHHRKDGSSFWGKVKGQAITDEHGGISRYFAMVEDITMKKRAEQALQIKEEKYRGIIANMNLGLLEVDIEEKILFANQSFCEMSGFSEEELIGQKASNMFANEPDRALIDRRNEARKNGVSKAYEVAARNKKGELRWWLISGAPRYNDSCECVGSIGIHLDITDQKKLQQDLIEAKEQAEESSRAKETFLANMSHEIRTPISAILGMSRELRKTELKDRQKFFLDTINAATENLLVVINDILDISKIEAGKLTIECIGFSMKEILTRAVRVMMHKAEEKGLQLHYSIDERISPVLMGDPYRLNQVLLNLISNAIKFTHQGSVEINCRLEDREVSSGHQMILLTVKDTGIGMDRSFLDNLFQKFLQEDKSVARKYGGTGLGMSICRQLAELMNGTIHVDSEKDKGTSIVVRIPLPVGTEKDLREEEAPAVDTSLLKDSSILLVEDNEMNRLVASAILNNYGVRLTESINGKEALAALETGQFDLVLMDVQMPVMDGLEATRRIRSGISGSIPIIALTANAIKGENDRCLGAGMNDYISKPFEEDHLIARIAWWLSRSGTTRIPAASADPGAAAVRETPAALLYDLSKLKEIGRGNESFMDKMIRLFLDQMPAAAREIKTALERQDFETIRTTAHRIKPVLNNMGVVCLEKEIVEIEMLAGKKMATARLADLIGMLEETIAVIADDLIALP